MPSRPPSPCKAPGCSSYAVKYGYCAEHQPVNWQKDRGTTKERGYGAPWRKLRQSILHRDMRLCQQCLRRGYYRSGNEVDHIVPKSQGGGDDEANLEVICTPCHRAKTAQEATEKRGGAG